MNILFLCSSRSWGGNEKWTQMAAHELSRKHNVYLAYRKKIVGERFTVSKQQLPFLTPFDLFTLYKLVKIIRQEKIDILIPTKRKDYMLAGLAAYITHSKSILRLGAKRAIPNTPYHCLLYGRLTSGIIVNADSTHSLLLKSGFIAPLRIRTIYNGLDLPALDRAKKAPLAKPFGFTIVAAGRLNANKGFDFLLRGLAKFITETNNQDVGIIILGEGPERSSLTMLSKSLGIENRVVLPGFIQEPANYLASADLYIQSSKNEGLSNALLEGMYLSGAVIATRAGGTEEVIEDGKNGLLIDYNDIDALAASIKDIATDNNKKQKLTEAAHRTAQARFSIKAMGEGLEHFFKDIQALQD